uniref:Uncharacterized protein n=1 Tax=Arundo donax TaxID=35708 RepID=A0A0A9HC84_ARUDO
MQEPAAVSCFDLPSGAWTPPYYYW